MTMSRLMIFLCLVTAMAGGGAMAADVKAKPPAKPTDKAVATAAPVEKGRDWSQIDTNKDGYIAPEEMDAWLKANPGPQK